MTNRVRITITMETELVAWVDAQVQAGDFHSRSEALGYWAMRAREWAAHGLPVRMPMGTPLVDYTTGTLRVFDGMVPTSSPQEPQAPKVASTATPVGQPPLPPPPADARLPFW